jgi:hypothetical protein
MKNNLFKENAASIGFPSLWVNLIHTVIHSLSWINLGPQYFVAASVVFPSSNTGVSGQRGLWKDWPGLLMCPEQIAIFVNKQLKLC